MNDQSQQQFADTESRSVKYFWPAMAFIAVTGFLSIVGIQNGQQRYEHFGGLAHFPLFWLAVFTILPGYIYSLITYPCRFNGGLFDTLVLNPGEFAFYAVVAMVMAAFYTGTVYLAFRFRPNWIKPLGLLYLLSIAINFLNFIFVSLHHL